jgi:hypothetical protein
MKVLDPGHEYLLDSIDGSCPQRIVFVKREGPGYPGNTGSHPGTTTQEVLRALIKRSEYVNRQLPCPETELATSLMKTALYLLESRAARRHGRVLNTSLEQIVTGAGKCQACGHIGCSGGCHARKTIVAEEVS